MTSWDATTMPARAWYRSLYWRIGLGFILFLAIVLAAQAGLFLWIASRALESVPTPARTADAVAADLADALAVEPSLDLEEWVATRAREVGQPIVLVVRGGAIVGPPPHPPSRLIRLAREMLRGRGGPGRRGRRSPLAGVAPVVLDGRTAAVAVVGPGNPIATVLRLYGPAMLGGGVLLLVAGTLIAAVLIFRPARLRLLALERASRAIGAGRLDTRAPEHGGDEIAEVAHAFNSMAASLAAREQELRVADRMRRQLLADVSHELMTPLTAIRGYLETLRMAELSLDAATRERYLGIVHDETLRVERLIGDLLDLARLQGGAPIVRERVLVQDLFDRVTARHEGAARAKRVTLRVRVADDACTVVGDPHRLEQALQNLAANALRHTHEGGEILLEAEADDRCVRLRVSDSGEGIPAEDLPHVFDRFYKADSARAGGQSGSGLGLSIVRAIVDRHGGRITVTSEAGRGTTFVVELPREASVRTEAPAVVSRDGAAPPRVDPPGDPAVERPPAPFPPG